MSKSSLFLRCSLGIVSLAVLVPLGASPLGGVSNASPSHSRAGKFVAYRNADPKVRAAVDAALARYKWVGDLHAEAMQAAIKIKAGSPAAACENTAALVERYIPRTESSSGIRVSNMPAGEFARKLVAQLKQCKSSAAMDVFGDVVSVHLAASTSKRDDITGDFINYEFSTGDSPWDLENSVYDTLSTAYSNGIASGDFDVLAGEGSLAISSGWGWDGVDGWHAPAARPFSIFSRPAVRPLPKWAKIAGADVLGCGTAAAATWYEAATATVATGGAAAPVSTAAVVGSCAIWGIGTSAVTWWTL